MNDDKKKILIWGILGIALAIIFLIFNARASQAQELLLAIH